MPRREPYGPVGSRDVDEPSAWDAQKDNAKNALNFWNAFMDLRQGPELADDSTMPVLDSICLDHLLCIIRAVSWVESKHGTFDGNTQGIRDPMQCGNPGDTYWMELTGQTTESDNFVGGSNAGNYKANDLPGKAAIATGFPSNSALSGLTDQTQGHNDASFNPAMSYCWGVIFLIHKINTKGDPNDGTRKTYKCRDIGTISDGLRTRLITGAVEYNGTGDAAYQQKITDTLAMIGCVGQFGQDFEL